MRKTILACAVALAACSLAAVSAEAQVFDHLKCYKMKDPHNYFANADLTPFQIPPFALEPGCQIRVHGTEFCIPVQKTLLPGGNAPSLPITGQALQNDYICYKLKCPPNGTTVPPVVASDQFGTRTLQKFTAKKICVPAIKGTPPPTTTTTTTLPLCANAGLPQCAGTCPAPQICVKDATTTFCLCCALGGAPCTTNGDCCVPFTCPSGTCQ